MSRITYTFIPIVNLNTSLFLSGILTDYLADLAAGQILGQVWQTWQGLQIWAAGNQCLDKGRSLDPVTVVIVL